MNIHVALESYLESFYMFTLCVGRPGSNLLYELTVAKPKAKRKHLVYGHEISVLRQST